MQSYIIQRVLLVIPTLLGLIMLVFLLLHVLMPYDPVDQITKTSMFGSDPAQEAMLRKEFGLEGGVHQQFWNYIKGLATGDLGSSIFTKKTITEGFRTRVPISFEIGIYSLFFSIFVSIPLGIISAVRQDKAEDYIFRGGSIILHAAPGFWIAILVLTAGSMWFGYAPPIEFKSLTEDPVEHFKIMLLPAILIGLSASGALIRLVRVQMLEVLRQDYITTARSKGLNERAVLFRHALKNCMIPVVTVVGMSLPGLIGGTVVIEQIFLIPGMGRYLVESVQKLDFPVIQSTVLVFASLLVFSNIIVDISYAYFDPRIRYA